jgi:putative endonuclease
MKKSGTFTRLTLRAFDSLAGILPGRAAGQEHLRTGSRGEEAAYFHLRRQGYVIIARNYRSPRSRSELDLVGWDGDTLCFIEVKTRTTREVKPAEAAVDREKQRDLYRVAREFLRRNIPRPASPPRTSLVQTSGRQDLSGPSFRFDIVSVYFEPGRKPQIELFKNAFRP